VYGMCPNAGASLWCLHLAQSHLPCREWQLSEHAFTCATHALQLIFSIVSINWIKPLPAQDTTELSILMSATSSQAAHGLLTPVVWSDALTRMSLWSLEQAWQRSTVATESSTSSVTQQALLDGVCFVCSVWSGVYAEQRSNRQKHLQHFLET